jgi:carboxypeptidase Taq
MRAEAAYNELIRLVRGQALLDSCAGVLSWDEETCLPPAGGEHRGRQMALLAGLCHERATDPRIGDLLAELEGSPLLDDPDSPAAVNVREVRRSYQRSLCLPRSLVEELARTTSLAEQEWAAAREQDSFARFRPWLEHVVRLKRREAECLDCPTGLYDALLDEYEPGARGAEIARLFAALREPLVRLVAAIASSEQRLDDSVLHGVFPVERQRAFGRQVAETLGFDFDRGRLDTAAHPFFIRLGPDDCRLTTRYQVHDFAAGLFAILHEVGHGLYEQGLDPGHHGTPLGEAGSLAVHEAQSRLWENFVGRGRAFWEHFFPLARRTFPALHGVGLDPFHLAVNRVRPSANRVQADEVTYNLHILVRFELEQALLNGDLPVADLPAAWNEAYRRYLGITPATDAEGCLQDGHWAGGLIGYFPTYVLGNLFAAQLFARAREDLGNLDADFRRGHFSGLLGWLRKRVHRHGSRYPAARLIERATGAPPSPGPLLAFLERKYGELYGL